MQCDKVVSSDLTKSRLNENECQKLTPQIKKGGKM